MIKLPEPVAWRAQYPTSNKWHYKDHGPIEYSLKQLTWEALVPKARRKRLLSQSWCWHGMGRMASSPTTST